MVHCRDQFLLLARALARWVVALGRPLPIPAIRGQNFPLLPCWRPLRGWRYPPIHNHAIWSRGRGCLSHKSLTPIRSLRPFWCLRAFWGPGLFRSSGSLWRLGLLWGPALAWWGPLSRSGWTQRALPANLWRTSPFRNSFGLLGS